MAPKAMRVWARKPTRVKRTTKGPELTVNLARHGEREGYRMDQMIHRVDLALPLPDVAIGLIALYSSRDVTGRSPPSIIIQETCDHHCLATNSFQMTTEGRYPPAFSFAPKNPPPPAPLPPLANVLDPFVLSVCYSVVKSSSLCAPAGDFSWLRCIFGLTGF